MSFFKLFNLPSFTPAQAWEKIKPYCAYQERCHSEVKSKLYEYGLNTSEVDQHISRLIEENFLNEERFALMFAGGHFRLKKWGKVKISYALKQKQVSVYCIKNALMQIPDDDYEALLAKLAETKWQQVKGGTPAARWAKTRNHLLQRGFESQLVQKTLQQLARGE